MCWAGPSSGGGTFRRWPTPTPTSDGWWSTSISWRRRWTRTRPVDPSVLVEGASAAPPDEPLDAAEIAARLRNLTANQRTVVVLRYYEHLTDAEIAQILGCRTVTVRTHASRALRTLRLELAAAEAPAIESGKERTR